MKQYMTEVKAQVRAQVGEGFSDEIFQKAVAKTKRWIKNAMGDMDYSELTSDRIMAYYKETTAKPDGRKTFNRGY